jgi:transposase InsO family protein
VRYAFICGQRRYHALLVLCQVLRVSRSGYYSWLQRTPGARLGADQELLQQIQRVHSEHRGHSGALKTWRVLQLQGITCAKHQVARLRQLHDIVAKRRRRYLATSRSKYHLWQAPNLLQRNFSVDQPDRVWVGDVTHVATRQGWLFLAVQVDLYSRRVVGWAMHRHNNTELLLDALNMAITQRDVHPGLIHHSDQGRPYAAKVYRQRMAEAEMIPSMSRRGDCWDNAVAESFFATLEFELIEQQVFKSRAAAKTAIFDFIEVFYNRQRGHQTLGYKTPLRVEQEYRLVA